MLANTISLWLEVFSSFAHDTHRENLRLCKEVVQASADDICECYKNRSSKPSRPEHEHGVWSIAPTLESEDCERQVRAPLFRHSTKTDLIRKFDIAIYVQVCPEDTHCHSNVALS